MVPKKKPDDSTYSGRFAIRLYELRKKAGLSAEQVAEAVGVSVGTVYNWEAGIRQVNWDYCPLLAETLSIKPRTLLPEK